MQGRDPTCPIAPRREPDGCCKDKYQSAHHPIRWKELSKIDELISNCDGLDQGESDGAKLCC
jgi:hypothetical protein